jgi:hypothetical protein
MSAAEKSARYRAKDVEAYRARKRELAKTEHHKQVRNEYMRKWREANREKHNQLGKESYHRNKHKHVDKMREAHLKRSYGLSSSEFNVMLAEQKGKCLICSITAEDYGKTFHVDHCHTSGKVRGLLCGPCNTKLGWYENNTFSIAAYLGDKA